MRLLLPALACLSLSGLVAGQAPAPVGAKDTLVYIGSQSAQGDGIHVFRLQSAGTEVFQNVTLVPLGLAAAVPRPSFFELDTRRRLLFAVSEIETFEGKASGAVSAFAVDAFGRLTLLNRRATMGPRPCHLALDNAARHLVVANCGSGTMAVVPIAPDGKLGEPAGHETGLAGLSCVTFDPAGSVVLACDATADMVAAYRFDSQRGRLVDMPAGRLKLKSGSGPRFAAFRPDARFAYVLNSKTSTITTFAFDAGTGALTEVQTVSTLPESFDGPNVGGELHVHRTGRWLYVSNVGHNSVVLFTTDFEKGTLTFVEEQGTGGKKPLHFGIEPSAKHLAIANTDSDTVLASRIDEGNGRLKPSGIFASVAAPASVRFLPPADKTAGQ